MTKEKEEVWREVPGYEDYMVSSRGRVKSLNFNRTGKEGVMKQSLDSFGYFYVALCRYGKHKKFKVHQLVAMAFLDHIPCGLKLVVDHYPDKTTTNNNLNNLRLVTQRENLSRRGGSSKYTGVFWHKGNKKWKAGILIEGKIIRLGYFDDELEAHHAYQRKLKEIQK